MPKRLDYLQVRGEDVRRWIREGRLSVFPAGTNRVLRVHRAFRSTFPPVRARDRANHKRRMTVSAGSYLNSRWILANRTWDVWPEIQSCQTPEDVVRLRARSILNVDGVWLIQIYEVVSGINKLRRQRVKIRANYHHEKTWRTTVMASIEADVARDAAGAIKLSPAERKSLADLSQQIQRRLQEIDVIGGQLSPREIFAYAGGWAELAYLQRTKRSLEIALQQALMQTLAARFDRYLIRLSSELGSLISLEIRRPRFWAQYHLEHAAEALLTGPQEKSLFHIQGAIRHLITAIETLQGWAMSLSEEEARYVIPA